MTEGTERNVDKSGSNRRQFLWCQATVGQGAGPVALREDVRLAYQAAQNLEFTWPSQIKFDAQLAMPGIPFLMAQVGEMSGGDLHDVGTMLGERARTRRSSEDARQIEHADVREWSVASWQRLWVTIADTNDLQQRQPSDRKGLRVFPPFRLRAGHAAGAICSNNGLLELSGVPGGNGTRHGVAILRRTKHGKRRRAMVGEIAVQITPASIPRGIDAHDTVVRGRNAAAGKLEITPAAQRGRGLAKVDCDFLTPPGANLPQLAGREPCGSQSCSTSRADTERRRQHGIGTASEHHLRGLPVGPTGDRQNAAQRFVWHGHDFFRL